MEVQSDTGTLISVSGVLIAIRKPQRLHHMMVLREVSEQVIKPFGNHHQLKFILN